MALCTIPRQSWKIDRWCQRVLQRRSFNGNGLVVVFLMTEATTGTRSEIVYILNEAGPVHPMT